MRSRFLVLTTALAIVGGCAAVAQNAPLARTFAIGGANGAAAGSGTVTEAPKGVLLRLQLTGLAPGWHAAHFHEKGDCSTTGFTSAGGHIHGATPVVHGLLNPAANDRGDLPNLFVGADGTATIEVFSPFVSLNGAGGRPALLDADGSAVVIHANADDYTTQPIGGAGPRIACGVIK